MTCAAKPVLVRGHHDPSCRLAPGHEEAHVFRSSEFDHPFLEVMGSVEGVLKEGGTVFQKFTCQVCGARQTMGERNLLFASGQCEECGGVTDIVANGCNFLLIAEVMSGDD